MRALFKDVECKNFRGIEYRDVLKVKDMSFMFYSCATFNQPLDKPANLKNQCRMFHNCKGFTYSLNDNYYFIYEAINK